MTFDPLKVRHNAFTENLGNDYIAVDQNGTPIARAATMALCQQAAPGAAAFLTGADFVIKAPPPKKDAEPKDGGSGDAEAPKKAPAKPKVTKKK